jgi:hypothetical protein
MAELTAQTFRLAVGQARTLRFTMTTPPAGGVGAWSMRFRVRDSAGVVKIDRSQAGGTVSLVDAAAGIWSVPLSAADATLAPKLYTWSFWDVLAGEESPVAYGTCEVFRTAETG